MQLFIQVADVAEAEAVVKFLSSRSKSEDRAQAEPTKQPSQPRATADDGWGDGIAADVEDPWADYLSAESGGESQRGSQSPSKGNPGPWADVPRSGDDWKDTKNGKRHLEFGLDDAPDCNCGYPAMKYSGKGAKGLWSKWQCALGSTKHYKDKCDFEEWANRK